MSNRILLVEDDPHLAEVLADALQNESYAVDAVNDGASALRRLATVNYDLALLDVQLPDQSGFEICRKLRAKGVGIPILMLSGRVSLEDRVLGLRLGADDYLTKPFQTAELLARIHALLRRTRALELAGIQEWRFGDVFVDFTKGTVLKGGERVYLSLKELQLLRYLVSRNGAVVSRKELLAEVWGYQEMLTRTVDVHIATLRQKLEADPQEPRYLVTVRGEGYSFQHG